MRARSGMEGRAAEARGLRSWAADPGRKMPCDRLNTRRSRARRQALKLHWQLLPGDTRSEGDSLHRSRVCQGSRGPRACCCGRRRSARLLRSSACRDESLPGPTASSPRSTWCSRRTSTASLRGVRAIELAQQPWRRRDTRSRTHQRRRDGVVASARRGREAQRSLSAREEVVSTSLVTLAYANLGARIALRHRAYAHGRRPRGCARLLRRAGRASTGSSSSLCARSELEKGALERRVRFCRACSPRARVSAAAIASGAYGLGVIGPACARGGEAAAWAGARRGNRLRRADGEAPRARRWWRAARAEAAWLEGRLDVAGGPLRSWLRRGSGEAGRRGPWASSRSALARGRSRGTVTGRGGASRPLDRRRSCAVEQGPGVGRLYEAALRSRRRGRRRRPAGGAGSAAGDGCLLGGRDRRIDGCANAARAESHALRDRRRRGGDGRPHCPGHYVLRLFAEWFRNGRHRPSGCSSHRGRSCRSRPLDPPQARRRDAGRSRRGCRAPPPPRRPVAASAQPGRTPDAARTCFLGSADAIGRHRMEEALATKRAGAKHAGRGGGDWP